LRLCGISLLLKNIKIGKLIFCWKSLLEEKINFCLGYFHVFILFCLFVVFFKKFIFLQWRILIDPDYAVSAYYSKKIRIVKFHSIELLTSWKNYFFLGYFRVFRVFFVIFWNNFAKNRHENDLFFNFFFNFLENK
jgi:hypothetical protein